MFSENYSVCLNDDGSPREIGRKGPVVTYKAIGYESGRTAAMQLIPLANVSEAERVQFEENAKVARKLDHDNIARVFDAGAEDDHLVFVSEYVEGESAAEWIEEHGPMPADAVLRIGYQVTNALAAAEERSVPAARAIQPANLFILPGVAADGGWPRIKVRNFGLPTLKLNSEAGETPELVPSMPPRFASPEQRENRPLDIRSDIFSLGATMWFLLTGSAPHLTGANESGPHLSGPDIPRFVRKLLSHMLRTNPDERPQDLTAFAERIRVCLQKAERRTAFTRSFAPAAIPGTQKMEKRRIAPAVAVAAAIVIIAALGAFLVSQQSADRERKPLGVLVGVPETTPETSPASDSPVSPVSPPQPSQQPPVIAQQSSTGTSSPASAGSPENFPASSELAENSRIAEPPSPAEGPVETSQGLPYVQVPAPAEESKSPPSDVANSAETAATDSSSTVAAEKTKPQTSVENVSKHDEVSKRKSHRQRVARSSLPRPRVPLRVGSQLARVVGTTANGNWVLRLPSGERLIAPPVPNLEDAPIVTPRHIRRVERPIPVEDEPPILVLPRD